MFTIHNLNYGADLVGRAMQACEVATTVSPTYAREVREGGWAHGGRCDVAAAFGHLRARGGLPRLVWTQWLVTSDS